MYTVLSISQDQIELLSQTVDRRFETRLITWLRQHFDAELSSLPPAATESGADLDPVAAFVQLSTTRAARYGIEAPCDVAVFVALVLANLRFRQSGTGRLLDGVRGLLDHRDADGPSKIALVLHELQRLARGDERLAALAASLHDAHAGAAWKIGR